MAGVDFTTVVAIDREYVKQFRQTYPTWARHKKELLERPLIVIVDSLFHDLAWWFTQLEWLDHPRRTLVPWHWEADVTQRERMLSAFVTVAPYAVSTPYWLKLDTDAVATNDAPWIDPAWFECNPAIVASGWTYTKPASYLSTLESWADAHPDLSKFPGLGYQIDPRSETFGHRRITSWLCFLNTAFTRRTDQFIGEAGRLPVPSQDTYHWYCATRMGLPVQRVGFKNLGWAHCPMRRSRDEKVRTSLA